MVKKDPQLRKPIDPTLDAQTQMGDTYGLTGVTVNDANAQAISQQTDLNDQTNNSAQGLLTADDDDVEEKMIADALRSDSDDGDLLLEELQGATNNTIHVGASPSVLNEQAVSGDMTDPESDDDMLLNSHQVGLRLDEDEDHPQELNMAADIAAAEHARRGS